MTTDVLSALGIVEPTIEETQQVSFDAISSVNTFMQEVLSFLGNVTVDPVSVSLPSSLTVSSDFRTPAVPVPPSLNITLPEFPANFEPGNIRNIDLNSIGAIPTFSIVSPTIDEPTRPNNLSVSAPTNEPTIDTSFTLPDQPDTTLPPAPTFRELEIPTITPLNLPTFDAILPNVNDISAPSLTFVWTGEEPYEDTLLSALKAELLDRITNGGTGLNEYVEQAIYDRGRDRERKDSVSVQEEIINGVAARGWSRPSGSTFAALENAVQEAQNKIADLSREILINQANLEQRNIEFALQTSLSLEQVLIDQNNNIMERAFRAQQITQQFAIDIYNSQVAQKNLELESYRAFSAAYEARIRGELSKVEIFRSQIEAQRLISEINKDDLQLYLGQIEAIRADAEIFGIIVNSVNTQLQAEGLKLDLFGKQIENYAAQVAAKRDEFASYADAWRGEEIKSNVFDSQVRAFISRIQAYSAQVDAQTNITQSDIAVEEQRLRQYLGQLDAITKEIEARTAAFRANVDLFQGQTQVYTAEVGAESARLGVELKQIENNIAANRAIADIAVENARISLANANNVDQLILEALKTAAQTYSSLASSALSALNVGASISGSIQSSDIFSVNHNLSGDSSLS